MLIIFLHIKACNRLDIRYLGPMSISYMVVLLCSFNYFSTLTVVGFEVFTEVVMKSVVFWDMTPCSLLCSSRLARWFDRCLTPAYLLKLFLQPWRWRRYVSPKRLLQLNRLHGVTSQKMILFINLFLISSLNTIFMMFMSSVFLSCFLLSCVPSIFFTSVDSLNS
jgi:hypothetical protein